MAFYNSGFPMTYQPVMPAQQFQAQQQQQNGVIWVQGEAAAKSYLVAPNSTVQLWDSEEKIIYLKSADASGMPSMKVLDYTIRGEEKEKKEPEYATKADLDALAEKVRELTAKRKTLKTAKEDEEDE
jgi:hypothetical protein